MIEKINVFNKLLLAASLSCGLAVSVLIGIGTFRQAKPNFDFKAEIMRVQQEIDQIEPRPSVSLAAIGQGLSDYNRKVANSKLLKKADVASLAALSDPELVKLVDHYKETAVKPFAVREYGVIFAIAAGVFSAGITIPSIWLVLCALWYVLMPRRTAAQVQKELI